MGMDEQDGWIWLDGEWLPWRAARVHVLTHTLIMGLASSKAFAYRTPGGPAIFRLDDHLQRLFESAHILGLTHDFTRQSIRDACRQVIARNRLEAG